MLKTFGININYIHISKLYILFPIILYSEHFKSPFGGYPVIDKRLEQNISLEQINREISSHFSVNVNSTGYKDEEIVKLRNRLNEYIEHSNTYIHPYINNSTILISSNTSISNNSEVINTVERLNSTIENSNFGIIIEPNIDDSIIENEVSIINSDINNANLGIIIKEGNSNSISKEEVEPTSIGIGNIIVNHLNSVNSNITGSSVNIGISIGN